MNDLYEAVKSHLEEHNGSSDALRIWEEIWMGFETAGADGLREAIDQLIGTADPGETER